MALELKEVRVGRTHEIGGPGVSEDVRREAADPAPRAHALEDYREHALLPAREAGGVVAGEVRREQRVAEHRCKDFDPIHRQVRVGGEPVASPGDLTVLVSPNGCSPAYVHVG